MNILFYAITAAAAYLIGCTNPAWAISKLKGVDMRSGGSGNLGTCNSVVMLGFRWGVVVCLYDMGKAALAVALARLIFPELRFATEIAGAACVLGHIFPFYLKFRGGKGFASYLGMTLALDWKFALALLLAVVVITVVTDYIVFATLTTVVTVPVYAGIFRFGLLAVIPLVIASLVIIWKHRENFVRLRNGTEIRLRAVFGGRT